MTTPENKRDEEAIIEHLVNVTPTLKSDALKLCARIRADEREKLAQWMISRALSTGHGDTIDDFIKELDWQLDELRGQGRE